ncbi:uncharacterized protein LOC144433145 [Glandiceps talaboti]
MAALHYAARHNHYNIVNLLVENRADVNIKTDVDVTPLHLAARYRSVIPTTSKADASVQVGDGEDTSPDIADCKGSVIQYLVSKGADINAKDIYYSTPLHFTAMRGNDLATRELLQCKGIDIESKDQQQMTPLHVACMHENTSVAQHLLDSGANVFALDEDERMPFHLACLAGSYDISNMLLDHTSTTRGAKIIKTKLINHRDHNGNTPLHLAVHSEEAKVVELCIEKGADVNAYKGNLTTPLHMAAIVGELDIVKLLLEHDAMSNAVNINKQGAIHLSAANDRHHIVEYLLDMGAKIDKRDRDRQTALIIAASNGHCKTIELLLGRGADVTNTDKNGRTVLYLTAAKNHIDALQILLQTSEAANIVDTGDNYENTPLHVASQEGHLNIITELFKAGAQIEVCNFEENTPLHLSAKHGRNLTTLELIQGNPDVLYYKNELANTPLHLASMEGHIDTVEILLKEDADVVARNAIEWTPLDCAAANGSVRTVTALLRAGSPVDPTDKAKNTPLHLAAKNGHQGVVETLLSWGANISVRDYKGRNCLDLAIEYNHRDVAMTIVRHSDWRDAMRNSTIDEMTGSYDTPLRKMIRKMPDVAKIVFDQCTEENKREKSHPEYAITFDFEFIDDTFCNWTQQLTEGNVSVPNSSSPFEMDGSLKSSAQPYDVDAYILKQNHPLVQLITHKQVNLLGHPVVTSLLRQKWNNYCQQIYYSGLFVYLVFVVFLTGYMLTTPPPYYFYSKNGTLEWYADGEEKYGQEASTYEQPLFTTICKWGVVGLSFFNIAKELIQLFLHMHHYFSIENLTEWLIYVLSFLFVIDLFNEDQSLSGIRHAWQWNCGVFAIFFAWMDLIIFLRKLSYIGIYVVMFTDMFKTFCRFCIVLILFLAAFALSFYALLMNQSPFSSPGYAMMKTFVMMTGEFEYDDLFHAIGYLDDDDYDKTSDEYFEMTVWYEAVTYVIFACFIVVAAILIMNLLVGLAVDDIKEVQEQAVLKKHAMQVELALDVEQMLPLFLRRVFIKKTETILPNKPHKLTIIKIYQQLFDTGSSISAQAIARALNPEKTEIEELQAQQEDVKEGINKLKVKFLQLKLQNDRIETMLRSLLTAQGIQQDKGIEPKVDIR